MKGVGDVRTVIGMVVLGALLAAVVPLADGLSEPKTMVPAVVLSGVPEGPQEDVRPWYVTADLPEGPREEQVLPYAQA